MPVITFYKSAEKSFFPTSRPKWKTLDDVYEMMGEHELIELPEGFDEDDYKEIKKKQPCFCGADLLKDQPRKVPNVIDVSLAVLDVDEPGAYQAIQPLLEDLAVGYVAYSSMSYTREHEKVRIVFPLDVPVPRKDWPTLWAGMNVYFKQLIDGQCKDPTRLYFLPTAPDHGFAEPDDHFIFKVDGPLLDMEMFRGFAPHTQNSRRVLGAFGFRDVLDEGEVMREVARDEVLEYAGALKRKASESVSRIGKLMLKALDGLPVAEHGERNETMFVIAAFLADKFYGVEPESMGQLFETSIEAMRNQGSKLSLGTFVSRFEAKSLEARERARQNADMEAAMLAERISLAIPGRKRPYSHEELASFAQDGHTNKQWVVQTGQGNGYYFYVDGNYTRPVGGEAMLTHAESMLAPALSGGVVMHHMPKDGEPKLRSRQEIMSDYGSVAEKVYIDLTAQRTEYDPKRKVLVEAPLPLRPIEPRYDPYVDLWFEVLCGGKNSNYEKLQAWVSVVTMLQRPCSCLYFHATANVGKSLLAKGLSRLWTTNGATEMKHSIADFNDAITSCPLIFGDERLPPGLLKDGTGELRNLIQRDTWSLNRKFMPQCDVKGALRLLIAANNDGILEKSGEAEALTAFDIEAISQRFLYIEMEEETKDLLDYLGGRPWIEPNWIENDAIAAHALWLRDEMGFDYIETKERFIVCGGSEKLTSSLSVNTGLRGNVCHLLVANLLRETHVGGSRRGVRVDAGRVLATAQGVLDLWGVVLSEQRMPSLTRVAQALEGLSRGVEVRGDYQYFVVSEVMLKAWADKMRYCTIDAINDRLDASHKD